jgi:hypothetical protein
MKIKTDQFEIKWVIPPTNEEGEYIHLIDREEFIQLDKTVWQVYKRIADVPFYFGEYYAKESVELEDKEHRFELTINNTATPWIVGTGCWGLLKPKIVDNPQETVLE